jgi:L-iditol 2-dehydrogenase
VKAAILHGRENIQIEDIAPPSLKSGEVRVRVEAALTCGTDLKVFKRGYHAKMIVPPAVFGHELAGVISEIAGGRAGSPMPAAHSAVKDGAHGVTRPTETFETWKIGDRVVVANSAPCGECFHCRCGQENLCEDLLFLNGAYAESIVIPARLVQKNLLRLKPETDFRDAALAEPLACVVQGVEDTQLRAGQNVLVIGAGPIGLMFVALAKKMGCHVTVAGRGEKRLQTAQRLGAGKVYEVGKDGDVVKAVIGRDGVPPSPISGSPTRRPSQFDVVIEAVGRPETWEAAVQLVRKGGTVNFFGGCPSGARVSLDTELIHYSNLTLLASFHHTPHGIRRALEFIEAGLIRAEDFVDGECPLSGLPKLFKQMAAGNHAIKTLIRVHE